jgi:hypothetical protein
MMTQTNNIERYSKQFENTNKLVGQTISEIVFYLEETDKDFTEQPNEFGKSLLNGIDIKTGVEAFSIGNRYTNSGYGLSIDPGQTDKFEFFDQEKHPVPFDTFIVGQEIKRIDIYWMKIPIEGTSRFYPQEIEILTDNGFFLISSIEVTNGQVTTEFTDEILIIDNKETARQLKLGQFGLADNGRIYYKNLNQLLDNEEKNGL